jgi:hypothetical protein
MSRLRQATQHVDHLGIDLARISLSGHGVGAVEAHLLADSSVEFFDDLVITVEQ